MQPLRSWPAYPSLAYKWSGARPIHPPLERTCSDRECTYYYKLQSGRWRVEKSNFFSCPWHEVGKWWWYKTPVDGFIVQSWSTSHVTSACTHFYHRALFIRKPRFGHMRRESSLCVRRFFAMYATQEFYSFSLILLVFVLPSKYIAEEEGAGG